MTEYKYKLTSTIPGITVELTHNPLNAKITISESAKRELILTKALEDIMENYVHSAKFHLEEKYYDVEYAKTTLDCILKPWFEECDKGSDSITMWKAVTSAQYIIEDFEEGHDGDCTAFPSSCVRCHAEGLIGIDTLPVSKSIGSRLWKLYVNSPYSSEAEREYEKGRLIREQEFQEKYPSNMSPEQIAHYTPIWAEHDRAAKEFFEHHINLVNNQRNEK